MNMKRRLAVLLVATMVTTSTSYGPTNVYAAEDDILTAADDTLLISDVSDEGGLSAANDTLMTNDGITLTDTEESYDLLEPVKESDSSEKYLSENGVSGNTASENEVSENTVSENEAEDPKKEQEDDPTAVIVTESPDEKGVYIDNNGFEYTIDNKNRKATVIKWTGTGKAVIPAKVKIKDYKAELDKGYRDVKFIEAKAFEEAGNHRLSEVDIPESVTEIRAGAFRNCVNLSSVKIPNSVTTLGAKAFEGCSTLSSAQLSTALTTLEAYVFNGCISLEEIEIPNSLDEKATVAPGAFTGADNLRKFTFGPNTKKLADNLFAGCTSMEEIDLPGTLTNIGKSSFANCTNLKRVTMPEDVKGIGDDAFTGCKKLEVIGTYNKNGLNTPTLSGNVVMMPRFISIIGVRAFNGCEAIEKLTIPRTVEKVGDGAFAVCKHITDIEFVEGDSEKGADQYGIIGTSAFAGCTSLPDITIPQTIRVLGEHSFEGCTSLEKVVLANEFADAVGGGIGSYAFNGCTSLNRIAISNNIEEIGAYAFANCTSLGRDGETVIPVVLPNNVKILAPCAFLGCTSIQDVRLSRGLETIGNAAFKGCTGLRSIELPASIKSVIWQYKFMNVGSYIQNNISPDALGIGDGGIFRDCENLRVITFEEGTANIANFLLYDTASIEYIVIPKTIKKIGEYAFGECINLAQLRYEEGSELTTIDTGAFSGCRFLNNYTDNNGVKHSVVPDNLTSIGNSAFYGCIGLEQIDIPSGVQKVLPSAFANCEKLEEAYVPNTVTELGDSCFLNCKKLKKAHIPDELASIPTSLFDGCEVLSDNNLPLTLKSIGSRAFYNCDGLKELDLTGHKMLSSILASAFEECDGLRSVKFSSATNFLGEKAFNSCDELVNIELGTGLTEIPVNGFSNLGKLEEIIIPRNVALIKTCAFENDSSLTTVHISKETEIEPKAFSYSLKLTIKGIDPSPAKEYAKAENIKFEPEPVSINKISFTETIKKLEKGKTFRILQDIKVEIEPVNYSEDLIFTSSDEKVFTVDEQGIIKGISKGRADLIASVDPKTAVSVNRAQDARITIDVREPVSRVVVERVDEASNAMYPGDVLRLSAEAIPNDAFDTTLTWSSNNPRVAGVDNFGVVTAYEDGAARIYAVAVNGVNGFFDVVVEKKPIFEEQTDVISTNKIGKPVASVMSGNLVEKGTVIHLTCDVPDANIWYTTNGKDPGADYNNEHYNYTYLYSGGITITRSTVIKAFAIRKGYIDSEMATFEYEVDPWGDVDPGDIGGDPDLIPKNIWFSFDEDDNIYKASDTGWPKITNIVKECTGFKQDFNEEIRVYDGTDKLVENRDYKVVYKNSIAAGLPTDDKAPAFYIKGQGNYKFDCAFRYEIYGEAEGLKSASVKVYGLNKKPEYTGDIITLEDLNLSKVGKKDIHGYDEVTLKKGSQTYTEGVDYRVDYDRFKASGSFDLIFELVDGTYLQKTITVKPYDFKKDSAHKLGVELASKEVPYSPAGATTEVEVTFDGEILKEGIDYTLSFKKNKKVGTAKAVIKGKGLFKGKHEEEFKVVNKPIDGEELELFVKDVIENQDISKVLKKPVVTDGGTSIKSKYLTLGTCSYYDVISGNEIMNTVPKAGTLIRVSCTVTATKALGNPYSGSDEVVGYYKVIGEGKDIKAATVTYKNNDNKLPFAGGNEIIPLSLTDFFVMMPANPNPLGTESYEIESITSNRFIGTCTVTLKGKGEYGGIKKCKFKIAKKTY